MKLTFSPASPFARKVRIAAIETGLIDKIEFVPAAVAPGQTLKVLCGDRTMGLSTTDLGEYGGDRGKRAAR